MVCQMLIRLRRLPLSRPSTRRSHRMPEETLAQMMDRVAQRAARRVVADQKVATLVEEASEPDVLEAWMARPRQSLWERALAGEPAFVTEAPDKPVTTSSAL